MLGTFPLKISLLEIFDQDYCFLKDGIGLAVSMEYLYLLHILPQDKIKDLGVSLIPLTIKN